MPLVPLLARARRVILEVCHSAVGLGQAHVLLPRARQMPAVRLLAAATMDILEA